MRVKMVSVICPVYNEERYIEKCIESIVAQDYPDESLEVFFVDGLSNDNTRKIIQEYALKYGYIQLLDNPHKVVPHALNLGIRASKGEVIIRLDGHCTYPTDYITTLVKSLYELDADNVGGVWNTLPARDNSVCSAIAIGSSHPFGVGGSKHKVGITEIIQTDTVPFGCYKREVFDKIGVFDEELIRNQDDEFNGRLINHGGKIFLLPQLVINYSARDSLIKMVRMYYQYGLFKPLVSKKLGSPATIRQFFPALFVAGLICGAILSSISVLMIALYGSILFLYFFLALSIAFRNAFKKDDWKLIFMLPVVFFLIHISYGCGYWVGAYKILFDRKLDASINR